VVEHERQGKGRGTYTATAGCSAFERELVGEDHDDRGIGVERADVLRFQRGEFAEYAPAGVRSLRESSWIRTANPKKKRT
jgi:hypothetical protein